LKKTILVSAGDVSGDLLLSKVVVHLKDIALKEGVELNFIGLAGDHCESVGVQLIAHSNEVAVVGIVEVVSRLKHIFGVLNQLSKVMNSVDSVLCVDFPDFNFRLSEIALKKSIPVDYLVSPQLWAWRSSRVERMKLLTRKVYPVLPFEETYLRNRGVNAKYLGHPLRDILPPRNRRESRDVLTIKNEDFVIALLPGSRKSEIKRHLPILLHAWKCFSQESKRRHMVQRFRAVLSLPPKWDRDQIRNLLRESDWEMLEAYMSSQEWRLNHQSWTTMQASDFAWIASGTATLEAAYYQLPHILFYRLSWLSAQMIQSLTSYFSANGPGAGLPNILLEKKVVPEILQGDLTAERLSRECLELLNNPIKLSALKRDLRWIPKKLGESGVSKRMAEDLWGLWTHSRHS
jgi:lipid-A-disaccharide synthase